MYNVVANTVRNQLARREHLKDSVLLQLHPVQQKRIVNYEKRSEMDTHTEFETVNPVYTSKLDYFEDCINTDISVSSEETIAVYPTTPITKTNSNIVIFDLPTHQNAFLDLNSSNLFVRCKVTKSDGKNLESTDMVVYSNNLLSTLWENVSIYWNNKVVFSSDNVYGYRSMIQKLCTAEYQNLNELFFVETSNGECVNANTDVVGRQTYTDSSKMVELSGPLYTDFTQLPKYIPNGVSLQIKLERNNDKFCLLSNQDPIQYKIEIVDLWFNLVRVHLFNPVLTHINNVFKQKKATIPYQSVVLKTLAVPVGSFSLAHDRLFSGRVPSKCVIGLVNGDAFNGKLSKNPFNFQPYGVSKINVSTDLDQAVNNFVNYNFAEKQTLEGYLAFSRVIGNTNQLLVNRDSWINGKTLHAFNLSPKATSETLAPSRNGAVRLQVEFSSQTTEPIVVVVLGVFDNKLYVDEQRNVSWE